MQSLFRNARSGRLDLLMGHLGLQLAQWWRTRGLWWAGSVTIHALLISTVLLLMGQVELPTTSEPAVAFSVNTILNELGEPAPDLAFSPSPTPDVALNDALAPSLETMADQEIATLVSSSVESPSAGDALGNGDGSGDFAGGLMGDTIGLLGGPAATDGFRPGRGTPTGTQLGNPAGKRGSGSSFGFRRGHTGAGRTKGGDRSVAMALEWFVRHQDPNGRWSLQDFSLHCTDPGCRCQAGTSDTAATAMALLPFLATGETHRSKSKHRGTIQRGLYWLASAQKTDGDLRSGQGNMYAHGLATIALCEAYGMTGDDALGNAAQRAIHFIVAAQDPAGGGWRYQPREPGDLSVVGWQLMALKSGMMAGLAVPSQTIERAAKFVQSVGNGKGGFGYRQPTITTTMSSVGLLCTQYLGARKEDEVIQGGTKILLAHLPVQNARDCYYWYYATQVMHHLQNSEWDTWNRQMRRVLVDSQTTSGCAAGSWDPAGHPHADKGGRLMVTSFNTLTLEVYYRYLPLYKMGQ